MTPATLSIHTMIVLLFVGNLMAVLLLVAYMATARTDRVFRLFALGKGAQALGWALLALRDQISPLLSVYLGNAFLLGGFALECVAFTTVRRPDRRIGPLFGLLAGTCLGGFFLVAHHPHLRVAVASLCTLLLFGTGAILLLRPKGRTSLHVLVGCLYAVFCLPMIPRTILPLLHRGDFSIFSTNAVQGSAYLVAFITVFLSNLAFLLLHRQEADQALNESEAKYRTLVERAKEAIWIIQDYRFVFVNPQAAEWLEVPLEDLVGLDVRAFLHPGDAPLLISRYEARIRGENPPDVYDVRLAGRRGRQTWVSLSATRIDWKGSPATMSLLTDITARKALELEREENIASLQKALSEVRTLSGLLPICASCKKIRDDGGYWNQLEQYISLHSEAEFTHGICPDCRKEFFPEAGA